MTTLVLNAPSYQVNANSFRSFSKTIEKGIGESYALNSKVLHLAQTARSVILLDKSARRKATGIITKIVATGAKTRNGIPQFDIHMSDLEECAYKSESLNRNGVSVI